MLLEPSLHTENIPAPRTDEPRPDGNADESPRIPADLTVLADRGRRDPAARRQLADALLLRRWAPDQVADALGLTVEVVTALARVRRPGTAAAHVAAELVPHPRTAA